MLLNWVDIVILLIVIIASFAGLRVGFLTQLCSIAGFFAGLFLGGWLFPHILPIHDRTFLTLVNGNLVLLLAVYLAVRGFDVGRHFHLSLSKSKLRGVESGAGIACSVVAVLAMAWLSAAMIGRLPFEGLSNSANDAYIVQSLDRSLPPVPAVFAEFNRLVDANSSPTLFIQSAPRSASPDLLSMTDFQTATAAAGAATVRITSFGCGGVVSGSGFVVAPGLVATAAHVIAGVKRPIIKYDSRSYEAVPVLFDPNLDFAVLQVKGLLAKPLALADKDVANTTSVGIIGYPDGNYTVTLGVTRNNLKVFGRNIYDVGVIGHDIYEVQTSVDDGSSGGPVVLQDGRVAGIIFAKSDLGGYGYAVTSPSLIGKVQQAMHSTRRVSTGICLAD